MTSDKLPFTLKKSIRKELSTYNKTYSKKDEIVGSSRLAHNIVKKLNLIDQLLNFLLMKSIITKNQ